LGDDAREHEQPRTFLFSDYNECVVRIRGEEVRVRRQSSGEWTCPVCGIAAGKSAPHDPATAQPSMARCRSCSTQFGVDDLAPPGEQVLTWQRLRENWLDNGGWHDSQLDSLTNLSINYREDTLSGSMIDLFRATLAGRTAHVRMLVARGVPVDSPSRFGETALMKATARNHIETVGFLLKSGANPNTRDLAGRTAVRRAWSTACVKLLVEGGADLNLPDRHGETMLMDWSRSGSGEVLRYLVEAHAELDRHGVDGRTALWNAVANTAALKLLLEHGANPNELCVNGMTPLIRAVDMGSAEVVRTLLAAGADPNIPDLGGQTALIHAVSRDHGEIADLLLHASADVTLRDDHQWDALFHAIDRKNKSIAARLLRAGADTSAHDGSGRTPLALAIERNESDIARLIADTGADE
jgi:ankyrin repeat protein